MAPKLAPIKKKVEAKPETIFEKYSKEICHLSHSGQQSVEGVLFSCVMTVINVNGDANPAVPATQATHGHTESPLVKNHAVASVSDIYSTSGKFIQLPTSGQNEMFGALIRDPNATLLSTADHIHASDEGLSVFITHAKIRSQITRLLSGDVFPMKAEMTTVERGINESELLSFSSLSCSDLFRSHQMFELTEMLVHHTKPLPNFTGVKLNGGGADQSVMYRKYFQVLSASTFADVISGEMIREPLMMKKYYPLTDDLLLALHWAPPKRRNKHEVWKQFPDPVIAGEDADDNASVGAASVDRSVSNEPSSPVTKSLNSSKSKKKLKASAVDIKPLGLTMDTVTLTPAGNAIVHIKQLNSPTCGDHCYLSVYVNGCVLGLRASLAIQSVAPSVSGMEKEVAASSPHMLSRSSHAVSEPATSKGCFFLHTEDNVRIVAMEGITDPVTNKKPDRQGTVCLRAAYLSGMSVTVCSNGTVKVIPSAVVAPTVPSPPNSGHHSSHPSTGHNTPAAAAVEYTDPLLREVSRSVGIEGCVRRTLSSGPFESDFLAADGSRTLYRRLDYKRTAAGDEHLRPLWISLLDGAPKDWRFVILSSDGTVTFYSSESPDARGVTLRENICDSITDPEMKCHVQTYADGRMVLLYEDKSVSVLFNDGTQIVTNHNRSRVFVSKAEYPLVEIDLELDEMCRSHSRGIEVPINKGGEVVRSRVSLPDGSAVMVKYDTRVTAVTNGSLKLVRRDRSMIQIDDSGTVKYSPRTSWNSYQEGIFAKECADIEAPKPSQAQTQPEGVLDTSSLASGSLYTMGGSPKSGKKTTASSSASGKKKPSTTAAGGKSRKHHHYPVSEKVPEPVDPAHSADFKETKFTFNILNLTSTIQDYEHNTFSINLNADPLHPSVILSGEVEGLKPPAISDNPMEPRVFIVNRAAEALEIVSNQDVQSLESLITTCKDTFKMQSEVHKQPNEMGPITLSTYFIQRRELGAANDGFAFEEVFGSRPWHQLRIPAAALFALRNVPALNFSREDLKIRPERHFTAVNIMERSPLTSEGYKQLAADLVRCEETRQARLKSIDRFAIEDNRSQAELDEEEAVTKRLKLAYRAAKTQAAKKKEAREKEKAREAREAAGGATSSGEPDKFVSTTIQEGKNESEDADDEEEDATNVKFDDDEEEVTDPEQLEVIATFNDFAEVIEGDPVLYVPRESFQDAAIRLCNCFVSDKLVEKALEMMDLDNLMNDLTLSEFRMFYNNVKQLLQEGITTMDNSTLEDDEHEESVHSSQGSVHSAGGSPLGSPPGSAYWSSEMGRKTSNTLPRTAPPLDFRQLDWSSNNNNNNNQSNNNGNNVEPKPFPGAEKGEEVLTAGSVVAESISGKSANKKYAAGSAVQAARVNNADKQ